MALLGTAMVVGMLGGFFANAGLSASELKEECGKAQDLVKQINEVSTFYTNVRDGLIQNREDLEQLITDSRKSVQDMNTKMERETNPSSIVNTVPSSNNHSKILDTRK